MSFRLSLVQNSHGRYPDLTSGETEGGPRPTLHWTQNWRGLVGWALAHLQSRSRIFVVSERFRVKRRVLQGARLRIVGIDFLLAFIAPLAMADGIRPVQVQVKELPSGAFDVQWSVPKVIPPQSMPSPWLPEQCRPDGERVFLDRPAAWMTRQVYRCPDGLAGERLGIRYPAYNIGLSTLLRVELLSGDRYAHMLNPGEHSWQIPAADEGGLSQLLGEGQTAAMDGIQHFFGVWVHLALLLVFCLLGGFRIGVRLATTFFLAQLAAVIVGLLPGVAFGATPAEIGIALATVLLAREALRQPDDRRQLGAIVACAGVVHGLAVQNMVSVPGQDAAPGVVALVLFVLGMDAALLLSVAVVSAVGRLVPSRFAGVPLAKTAAYGAAGVAVALGLGALIGGPAADAADAERTLELPSILSPSGSTLPGSRRLASNVPDAAFQTFVSIEAFVVRHEVLVRLRDVASRVGIGPGPELAVEDQDDVKIQIRNLVFANSSLEIDGEMQPPTSERVDFLTLDDKGVLPRSTPVPEVVESAWVGVTTVYFTPATSQTLAVSWDFIEGAAEIPATVTDPESTRSVLLNPGERVLRWDNELAEDPVPRVSTTAVEPPELIIPVWSLLPLVAALVFIVAALRRRQPAFSMAAARVMLVAAILLGPLGNFAVALPASAGSAPGTAQAKRILARVLPNIYRAFEFREESAVFDRLAMAVTGEVLTEVYLDHRKVLEMEERGGARARV